MSQASSRTLPSAMGTQLVDAIGQLVARAKDGDTLQKVTVVTPTFYSSYYLRRALSTHGLFNVEFTRIDEIAETLAADTLRRHGSRPLGRLQASELVYAAATRTLSDATPLGRIRTHDATQRALHRTFTDMAAVDDSTLLGFPADGHFGDLLATYRTFRNLSGSFHDRRTVAQFAADAVSEHGKTAYESLGRLVVVLVEAPPAQYRPLWLKLIAQPDTAVALGLTGESNADELVTLLLQTPISFVPTDSPLPRLISAPSRVDEVRLVVREVIAKIRTGKPLSSAAVLHADPSYGPRLRDAFELAGIPTCGPDPSIMGQTPEGRFLSGLFRMIEEDLARDAVTVWLTSAPIRSPVSGNPAPAARWDAISRLAGVTKGSQVWEHRLLAYAAANSATGELEEDEEPSTAESRARLTRADYARQLADFMGQLANRLARPISNWREAANWLAQLVEEFLAPPQGERDMPRREWIRGLIARISALDEVDGLEQPTLGRLATIIRQELDRPLRTSHGLGSGVFIGSIGDAAGCVFDSVQIVGMTEGMFPPPDHSDPLLPDDVRAILDPSGLGLPGRRTRQAISRRRFLAAMTMAPDVALYWPRSATGAVREAAPAPWFVEQARRYDNSRKVQAGDLLKGECPSVLRVESGATSEGLPDMAGDVFEYDVTSAMLWRRSARRMEEFPLPADEATRITKAVSMMVGRDSSDWTRFDGNLSGTNEEFAAPSGPVSPTRYEKYAACPFRYFLGELVRIEPTERPEDDISLSPLARGTLVHRILEAFVGARGDWQASSFDAHLEKLHDIAEIEFRRFEQESLSVHPAIWDLERRSIQRKLRWWLLAEARHMQSENWAVHRLEQRFGIDVPGALPAARVELADGRVIMFRGVMDRVDLTADGKLAAVSDYKTGSQASYRGIDDDPVLRGTKLQLAVYAAAVSQAFPAVEQIRSSYWFVFEDPGKQFVPPEGQVDLDEASNRLRAVGEVVTNGISKGLFPARPGHTQGGGVGPTFSNCTYCEYDRICPTKRQRQWAQKNRAEVLRDYVEMTGDLEATR